MLEPAYAINTLRKRFNCYLGYKFNFLKFFPESITFFLTHRCNLRCKMCGQSKMVRTKEELSLEEFKSLVDEIAFFNPNITLYGGEPLLYDHVESLVEYIKFKGLHLTIITNGTFLEKYAKAIVENNVDIVSVSIDGPAKLHDEIRGVSGAFDSILKGIASINKLKKELGRKKPFLNIVFTISGFNYRHIEDMLDIARDFGAATLNFHHLIYINEELAKKQNEVFAKSFGEISCDWEGFFLSEAKEIDADILIGKINKLKNLKTKFLINFYPNFTEREIKQYYSNPEFLAKSYNKRCLSPWMTAYVYPDGSIKPCLAVDFEVGNVKKERFLAIWLGAKFKQFRDALKKEKLFPVCSRCTELYRY